MGLMPEFDRGGGSLAAAPATRVALGMGLPLDLA
jgi:hypothetical protein